MIDLKAMLVEREDCDAGTVQQLRNGLAQGKTQYRTLRDVADVLKKKVESSTGAQAKNSRVDLTPRSTSTYVREPHGRGGYAPPQVASEQPRKPGPAGTQPPLNFVPTGG